VPLYEYVCRDCGAGFEKLVRRFGDAVDCPTCSSAAVDKQLSVFAVASPAPVPQGCGMGACGAAGPGGGVGPCGGGACGLPS
jgi:putative FmdB family regulatory protein